MPLSWNLKNCCSLEIIPACRRSSRTLWEVRSTNENFPTSQLSFVCLHWKTNKQIPLYTEWETCSHDLIPTNGGAGRSKWAKNHFCSALHSQAGSVIRVKWCWSLSGPGTIFLKHVHLSRFRHYKVEDKANVETAMDWEQTLTAGQQGQSQWGLGKVAKKQEHKVSYRCSLPSPLQKRSKDSKELHCRFASFELLSFLWLWKEVSQKAEKLLAKVKEKGNSEARVVEPTFFAWFEPKHLQNLNASLCNSWISSVMAVAMSIYRTLCVLVLYLKIACFIA